jgi:nitrite reductase/ring-hydroxylating ferredoxin subunit
VIPNQWYGIVESDALARNKPFALARMGERLVLWRDANGAPVCFADRCAHRGIALSLGRVKNDRLACAYHGLEYDTSGRCVHIPCAGADAKIPTTLATRRYVTREQHGFIWLWWGDDREVYPPIPWIDEIPTDERGTTRSEVWPFNYVRCVENHLDVHHWAFVHPSIMLGVGEYFADFKMAVEEEGLSIKTAGTLVRTNRYGKRAKRGWDFKAYCRLPNLSLIQVTPRFKSLIMQTPIDDETSWVCVRSFQTYSRIQPFKWLIDQYCMTFLFSVPLHRQDFPIFHEQRPRHSGVGVNKLVGADAGIAKYLMARERLLKEARAQRSARAGNGPPAPWDARLDESEPPGRLAATNARSLLPDRVRNVGVGREHRIGRAAAWAVAAVIFPLLLPSLITTRLHALWDAR